MKLRRALPEECCCGTSSSRTVGHSARLAAFSGEGVVNGNGPGGVAQVPCIQAGRSVDA